MSNFNKIMKIYKKYQKSVIDEGVIKLNNGKYLIVIGDWWEDHETEEGGSMGAEGRKYKFIKKYSELMCESDNGVTNSLFSVANESQLKRLQIAYPTLGRVDLRIILDSFKNAT